MWLRIMTMRQGWKTIHYFKKSNLVAIMVNISLSKILSGRASTLAFDMFGSWQRKSVCSRLETREEWGRVNAGNLPSPRSLIAPSKGISCTGPSQRLLRLTAVRPRQEQLAIEHSIAGAKHSCTVAIFDGLHDENAKSLTWVRYHRRICDFSDIRATKLPFQR